MQPVRPIPLGTIDHRVHEGRVFGLRPEDLFRHLHVIGRSGMGKSTLLEGIAAEVMARGYGLAVLDPHGDLVERLLHAVPRVRTNDLIFLDAADTEHPVGWNPLAEPGPPFLVASQVLAGFRKVFADAWGPRLEHIYRQTLLALLDTRAPTLLAATRMLADERFRARIVAQVRDPLVSLFWTREFAGYSTNFLPEVLAPVQNKLGAALTSTALRGILGQRRSTFRPTDVMAAGRILLVRLAKGSMGEDASRILGALLVGAFQSGTYARATIAPEARRPFVLVVDEFGSFVTPSFTELFAESRKFSVALVLAHQHLEQVDDDLQAALFGNTGTRVIFSVGSEDAERLARETHPELDVYDLVNLAPRQMVVRLALGAEITRPFTARSLPPRDLGDPTRAELLRRLSRERYGRPRSEVEAAIRSQLVG